MGGGNIIIKQIAVCSGPWSLSDSQRLQGREKTRSSMRSTLSNKGQVIMDYERMSNAELYALLKEKMPAVAETVGKVRDSNRETVIAFLRFVQTYQDNPV